jgi:hypothetical protein
MNNITEQVVTIGVAIIGLATLAVLVSRNSNTAGVIREAGGAFSNALSVAVSPITGGGGGMVASNFGNW